MPGVHALAPIVRIWRTSEERDACRLAPAREAAGGYRTRPTGGRAAGGPSGVWPLPRLMDFVRRPRTANPDWRRATGRTPSTIGALKGGGIHDAPCP